MNAPVRVRAPPAARVDPLKVFIARAQARAQLWVNGELTLHDAVDELWAAAVRDGLVDRLGADEVQRLLADAFAPLRTDLENQADNINLKSADDEYDADERQARKPVDPRIARARRLLDDDVSFERAWHEMNNPLDVPTATLEAAEYLHNLGDLDRFKKWFDRHDAAERAAIFRHLDERKKGRGK